MQEKMTVQEITENNVISNWCEKYMNTKKEFAQYKKSKQASYEALQIRCNELEIANRRLSKECVFLEETFDNRISELQKYIADIADFLNIDRRATLTGQNSIEYYAILSSTIKNRIQELIDIQKGATNDI